MGALLGLSIGGVVSLPWSELLRWRRYWIEEPWGAYRDNMHAAMIVSELLKPHYREGAKPLPMSNFMFELQEDRDEAARTRFVLQLESMARADASRKR